MSATCVILARAGSRGLPGKNWAPVAGRPCAAWTIEAARGARGVARVVVSTDAPEVAGLARAAGCDVVERPPELAGDAATVDAAARHAVRAVEDRVRARNARRDPVVILYANVPVRPPGLIDRALAVLAASGCDSVQSYAPVGKLHPWWMVRLGEDGVVRPWEGEVLNHGVFRRQDLPPAHVPDGGVIALTRPALFLELAGVSGPHAFFGAERRGIVTGPGEVVDIDTAEDLWVAEAALRGRTASGAGRGCAGASSASSHGPRGPAVARGR
ncbi:MAG TPA: acylneuraminate cytidylyltransferase family protein [Phycisphaerales bacterium]|nr:acylneuraminate cytidylyltransferase family protein [Phycisphaerales bacterium]